MSTTQTPTQAADAPTQIDDELREALDEAFNVPELRSWMSAHGLSRSRGASKAESIRMAVEQGPAQAEQVARGLGGDFTVEYEGVEQSFRSGHAAEAFAKGYKSENPRTFPRARDDETGEGLYGC